MEETFLSSDETAAFLKISKHQLYKLSRSGKLPIYSPTGGKIYFLKSELEEWILNSKRATIKNISRKTINSLTLKLIK